MFLATNAICGTRHTHQPQQLTNGRMLNKAVRANLLITFMSVVSACSGIPLIPGV
jgi:hypothetical protein